MKYKLGDLLDSVSEKFNFNGKDYVIFVNTGDVFDGVISGTKSEESKLPGQAKKSIENNDILFSEIRPKNKRYALVNNLHTENYVVSTKLMVLRNKNNNILNTKYIYYYLTSPLIVEYLQNEAEGRSGTFPQITYKENIANLTIELPMLKEQEKVINKIDSLNAKIKLNNKINDNLAA